jgi:hypothetical protein
MQDPTMNWETPPMMEIDPTRRYSAVIETSRGSVVCDLFAQEAQ